MSSYTRQATQHLDNAMGYNLETKHIQIIAAIRNVIGHLEWEEEHQKPKEAGSDETIKAARRNMFDGVATIEELIGQVVGAGSTCWDSTGSAEFDSARASVVVDDALQRIWQLRNRLPYQMSDAEYNELRGRFG